MRCFGTANSAIPVRTWIPVFKPGGQPLRRRGEIHGELGSGNCAFLGSEYLARYDSEQPDFVKAVSLGSKAPESAVSHRCVHRQQSGTYDPGVGSISKL